MKEQSSKKKSITQILVKTQEKLGTTTKELTGYQSANKAVAKYVYHQIISPELCQVSDAKQYVHSSVKLFEVAHAAAVNREVVTYTLAVLLRSAFGEGLACDMNNTFVSNSSYDFGCRNACVKLREDKGYFYLSCDEANEEHSLHFAFDKPHELCVNATPTIPLTIPMMAAAVVDQAIREGVCSDANGNLGVACTGVVDVSTLPKDLI